MSSQSPLLSIVVLNYNGHRYLTRTIPSFLSQSYPDVEVIVSDNGSTDESLSYLASFSKVRILKNGENIGYNQGKNNGVKEAKGDFVLLLDEDIELPTVTTLHELVLSYLDLKDRHQDLAFLAPMLLDSGSARTKYYGIYYSFVGKRINNQIPVEMVTRYKDDIRVGAFHGGAVLFEKKRWEAIGGFDEDYKFGLDDFDIGARASILGYSLYLFKQPLIHLGKSKDDDKRHFAAKYATYYEGLFAMAYKNFSLSHLVLFILLFPGYVFVLNFLLILNKRNLYLLPSPLIGLVSILKTYKVLIYKRKEIQSRRKVKSDNFLLIVPPKFF
jgi:O-antigen biosynthesis protein